MKRRQDRRLLKWLDQLNQHLEIESSVGCDHMIDYPYVEEYIEDLNLLNFRYKARERREECEAYAS